MWTNETNKKLWEVVGIDDLEGSVFAQCTSKDNAEKAMELLEASGLKDCLKIQQSNLFVDRVEINLQQIDLNSKRPLYTWDDLYKRADDKCCGSPELQAKDTARWEVRDFAIRQGCDDLENKECPEDYVENYCNRFGILFDEKGYIASFDPVNALARVIQKKLYVIKSYSGVTTYVECEDDDFLAVYCYRLQKQGYAIGSVAELCRNGDRRTVNILRALEQREKAEHKED